MNEQPLIEAGRQLWCPDCRAPLAKPDSAETVKKMSLSRHRGSKTCEKLAKALEKQMAHKAMSPEAELLDEPVVFLSPMAELRIWLKMPKAAVVDGRRETLHPGVQIEFKDGRYSTRDPEMVALMRRSPSNEGVIRAEGGFPSLHKDRFYELGVDPRAAA